MLTKILILTYYKHNIKTILKTNLSKYIGRKVFSQFSDNSLLNFVIFFSKNFDSTKCNYKINTKELLAIIKCHKQLKLKLKETKVLIKIIINYKNLKYFMTTKKLIKRQAHWVEFLLKFNIITFYILKKKNQKVDLLIFYSNNLF